MGELSGVRESFEDPSIQAAAPPQSLEMITSTVARDTTGMMLIAWLAAKVVMQELEDSEQNLALTQTELFLPSKLDSSSEEVCKSRKNRTSKKNSSSRSRPCFRRTKKRVP